MRLLHRWPPALFGWVVLLAALPASRGWAQAPATPTPPVSPPTGAPTPATDGGSLWLTALMLLGLLVVIGAIGKFLDLRRKRQAEGVHLQAQVSDALLRDPVLFGLPITPTAHVPTWRGSPATLEISGHVPSPEIRRTVLRIARDEAARLRPDVRVEDHLAIDVSVAARAA